MNQQPLFHVTTIMGERPGPRVLITAGVHGDEFTPMQAARDLLESVKADELGGSLTVVPIVNQSAFLRGTREGDDGKDLARTFPGNSDGSITERVAWQLTQLIRDADYYVDLHTGSASMSVLPLTGYVLHRDSKVLEAQRAMARAFNLPIIWGTSPNLAGRSLSVARDANVPAIYAEYLGSGVCDAQGVSAYVNGCLNVLSSLGMQSHPLPDNAVEQVVEDSRPDSGHMQIQNLAPATGFFEAAVSLGDHIEAGQSLGRIWRLEDNDVAEAVAQQNGLMIALRTFPRVHKGDSLGVILESDPSAE